MKCPVCGADLENKKVCECGWEEKEETTAEDVTNETTEQVLPENEDKIFNIEGVDDESLAAAFGTPEELDEYLREYEIDFKKIQEEEERQSRKTKKKTPWGVAIVSFLAGVLATLIVIGSLNGTILKLFDRVMYGSPKTSVETFFDCVYETHNEDEFLKVISPYQRETVKNAAIQFVSYGYVDSFEIDENVDVNDDKAFAPYVKAYLSYFASSGYSVKIDSFESSDVIYYNNTSSTYDLYAKQYLPKSTDNKNVQLYADINCSLDLTIKSDQTSQSESSTEEYKIVCAKIDGKWQVVTVLAAE